jgi:cell wall-associated NlpC family hydrolase
VSAVQNFRMRLRALALVGTLVAVAVGTTAAQSGRVDLDGAPDQAAADVLHVAKNQLGDDYVWGGDGPDGWDCSGLSSLWRSVGGATGMPRVSRDQQAWAIPIPAEQLKKGDLVFFGNPVTHVGIVSGGGYMVDAAASRKAVVERRIWTAGVVRYGRVPRPTMPKVLPWTPPPLPAPDVTAPVADSPVAAPRTPRKKPATTPTAAGALTPLKGLPGAQAKRSSATALKAAAGARSVAGSRNWDDVRLVREAWRHAGGGTLPATRGGIVAKAARVALKDARVGDLVVYDRPDTPHLGIYLGHGYMVDASAKLGKVVVRRVYAAPSVRLARLG